MDYDRRTTDTKLSKLEIEVSAMKEKISFFNVIYQKFDDTLDKVQNMIEDRRNETNQDLKEVYGKIGEVETKIMNEIRSMREDMKKQHNDESKKIEDLNKWRWMVVGAAAIVSWVLSRMSDFIK